MHFGELRTRRGEWQPHGITRRNVNSKQNRIEFPKKIPLGPTCMHRFLKRHLLSLHIMGVKEGKPIWASAFYEVEIITAYGA